MSGTIPASSAHGGVGPGKAAGAIVLVFLCGVGLGQLGVDSIGRGAVAAFKAIASAHYRLYLARDNLNADGDPEFAVLVGERDRQQLERFVAARPGWSGRDAAVPGWVVVTAPAGTARVLEVLRSEPFARAVLRNRGMWICH